NTTGQTAIHLEFRWPSAWTRLAAHLDFATAAVTSLSRIILVCRERMVSAAIESSRRRSLPSNRVVPDQPVLSRRDRHDGL
ncbi:hypothetical protein, partial [Streptomyces europaeiscabiei]|uniref:hypothetical protein n=1 Tax=Streptomyces europaeiscabiei TaxID=146819 RepID=UPI0029A90EAF